MSDFVNAGTVTVYESWHGWDDAASDLALHLAANDLARVAAAYDFADRYHGEQRRPGGDPYIWHLLQTLEVLAVGLDIADVEILNAGLLHDVVEDTDAAVADVAVHFGDRTANLVEHVTMPDPERTEGGKPVARRIYLERLRTAPPDVLLVKLADRYSNVQRLDRHPSTVKQRSYYAETVDYFIPLANGNDRFRNLFAAWQRAFAYLGEGAEYTTNRPEA